MEITCADNQAELSLTAGQLTALNNVGRDTGIFYRLGSPDELLLTFQPTTDLVRTSEYIADGRAFARVTVDPPHPDANPPNPDMDPDQPSSLVTCAAFGAAATASTDVTAAGRLMVTLGDARGLPVVVVTADPPGGRDAPPRFRLSLIGSAEIDVFRGTGLVATTETRAR